jgi:hypothetical protein
MTKRAIVCDCCDRLIAVGTSLSAMRHEAEASGAVYLRRRDMCGRCWGRGCEFGQKHLRRAA